MHDTTALAPDVASAVWRARGDGEYQFIRHLLDNEPVTYRLAERWQSSSTAPTPLVNPLIEAWPHAATGRPGRAGRPTMVVMSRAGVAVTGVLAVTALTFTTSPASAAPPPRGACNDPDPGRPAVSEEPWAQLTLDPRSAVWPHSTGKGVLVAVIDSGVDSDHPQLRKPGKVRRGEDFHLVGNLPGNFDCSSHGTAVAGILAASPVKGIGFAGVAPDATILPVRITERDLDENGSTERINPVLVARGIRYAADRGADVINLSLAGVVDDERIRSAVAYARKKDAVIVAAVGAPREGEPPDHPSYPASYPGVLGVGAIDHTGHLLTRSRTGPQVDIVAPGGSVLGATRVRGHQYWDGSSFATPFVAGTAALVRAKFPKLKASAVIKRILATTTPAPGGRGYGDGLVNPYRAVTDRLTEEGRVPLAPAEPAPVDPEQVKAAAWWSRAGNDALIAAGALALATVVGFVSVLSAIRGRRRRWRAGRAAPVSAERAVEGPPDEVFIIPAPQAER